MMENKLSYFADLLDGKPQSGDIEMFVDVAMLRQLVALASALDEWIDDNEGMPSNPSDARLLKAFWTFDGDRLQPCPECDGECGEPCAPCTVKDAHGALDAFIERWRP